MTDILTSYLGEFSSYSGSKFNFGPFFRFFVKMAAKTISVSVFTSDSNFSSSTLLKTTYISIGMKGTFRDIGGQSSKIQKLQNLIIRNFSIFRGHCDLVSPGKKLAKSVFTKPKKVIFPMLGLENFEALFSLFRKTAIFRG